MNNIPYISVVMSVYNAEKYLAQAVESILNQSFKDFEFIIIEDCSTDNSLKILEDFALKDSRIKLIRKDKNKGMRGFIENLNIGLSQARGKYIARMDADDISHPIRLEKQFLFLEEHSDIFMVGSSVDFIDENDSFIKKFSAFEKDEDIKNLMPKQVTMYHPVIMFRNEGIKYRENTFYCEDYDLYLRLMNEGKKFYNFEESLLDYRILKSSISRKDGSFMRNLFVEKVRAFYYEEKRKGRDSYHLFSPDSLLNILDEKEVSTKEDLKFALNTTTKLRYKSIFKELLQKYERHYELDSEIYFLKILNSLPHILTKIYFKMKFKSLIISCLFKTRGGEIDFGKAVSYNPLCRYSL